MHVQFAGPFGAAIPQKLPRPPAFEIAAAPNVHFADVRQLERAIDPGARAPARRRHRPIRMIIERNYRHAFGRMAKPERGQIMEIAGAVENERREPRLVFAIKVFDDARRRAEAQARPPLFGVDPSEPERVVRPGVIKIDMYCLRLNKTSPVEV